MTTERDPWYPGGQRDASLWVAEFFRIYPDGKADADTMLGWFANAIETGVMVGAAAPQPRDDLLPPPLLDVARLTDIAEMALGEVATGHDYGRYHVAFREHFRKRLIGADTYRPLAATPADSLGALRALSDAADEGPWSWDRIGGGRLRTPQRAIADLRYSHNAANADLIVAAVNYVRAALRTGQRSPRNDELLTEIERGARLADHGSIEDGPAFARGARWAANVIRDPEKYRVPPLRAEGSSKPPEPQP